MKGLTLISDKLESCSLGTWMDWFNGKVFGNAWIDRTVSLDWDPIFLAAGALTGLRVSASMFLGGTLCWAVFVPILQERGIIAGTGYTEIVRWTVWGGVSCMVTSGLLSVALQWHSVLRAMGSLGRIFRKAGEAPSQIEAIEAPMSWFVAGQLVSLVALAVLAHATFGMPYWQSTVAVLLTFFLALVACRITGETDTTPIGAWAR